MWRNSMFSGCSKAMEAKYVITRSSLGSGFSLLLMLLLFPHTCSCSSSSPRLLDNISRSSSSSSNIFNVLDYGAVGDGKTDDSQRSWVRSPECVRRAPVTTPSVSPGLTIDSLEIYLTATSLNVVPVERVLRAFLKAWKDACGAEVAGGGIGIPTVVLPRRPSKEDDEFLVNPVMFRGPCNSRHLHFQVGANVVAPNKTEAWGDNREAWIGFVNVDGLSLNGGGSFDGRGLIWWHLCNTQRNCTRPTALFFNNCNRLRVSKLRHLNSPRNHIGVASSSNVKISNLHISAPEDSPNTDGIDISGSTYIYVEDTFIRTGDDCIAVNGFSSYITISKVVCGPGHGISVGSLGEDGAYQTVSDVHVKDCVFNRTLNGARIKTWKGGSGYVKKIKFERITLIDSGNPIIINQDYVDNSSLGPAPGSNIQISEVSYDGVVGTSSEGRSIYFNCEQGSSGMGCTDIFVNNVHISAGTPGVERLYAVCINAHGNYNSSFPTVPCLSPL